MQPMADSVDEITSDELGFDDEDSIEIENIKAQQTPTNKKSSK